MVIWPPHPGGSKDITRLHRPYYYIDYFPNVKAYFTLFHEFF